MEDDLCFKHIPKDLWPLRNEHVKYDEVYRAVKNKVELDVNDFSPSNVERRNKEKTFGKIINRSYYSVSLFTTLESLKATVLSLPKLDGKIKAYAKGFTSIERGVSTEEDKVKHHVDYFLYDYIDNSPKDDFCIVEVRDDKK